MQIKMLEILLGIVEIDFLWSYKVENYKDTGGDDEKVRYQVSTLIFRWLAVVLQPNQDLTPLKGKQRNCGIYGKI